MTVRFDTRGIAGSTELMDAVSVTWLRATRFSWFNAAHTYDNIFKAQLERVVLTRFL